MNTTYIIYSNSIRKFYTGQTHDLTNRLEEHNRGKSSFTSKGIPWKIVYSKEFTNRSDAVRLERSIKKRGASRFLSDNNLKVG